jgi:hypothetical protein
MIKFILCSTPSHSQREYYKVIKKNKSQQGLQIINHVSAEFYVNFAEMSKKYQVKAMVLLTLKKSFRFRQSLRTFPVIVSNNYPRISRKVGFTIELIIEVGNQ